MLDINFFKKAFKQITLELKDKREYLNELDSKIGDSDHGESITRAFARINQVATDYNSKDVGEFLQEIGKQIISSGGAAMGPLYGSAFLEAGKEVEGKKEIDLTDLKNILQAMEQGIVQMGKAEPGDKTMLDSLHPAVNAFQKENNQQEAVDKALQAAEKGMEATKDMESKIGRSSRLQQRSIGYIDPGAVSMLIILQGLLSEIKETGDFQ